MRLKIRHGFWHAIFLPRPCMRACSRVQNPDTAFIHKCQRREAFFELCALEMAVRRGRKGAGAPEAAGTGRKFAARQIEDAAP